jgi:hypothetical protein
MLTQDLIALYQLAQTADIKVSRATEVAALLQRTEIAIATAARGEATTIPSAPSPGVAMLSE